MSPDGLCYIHHAISIMQIAPGEIFSSHECMLHTSFVRKVALNNCETPLVRCLEFLVHLQTGKSLP